MTMRAATLFSGIGAPEVAMPGWHWLWHAEIEAFPSAVMAARHPGSINLGDVTAPDFAERALHAGRPDIVVFGSPCQSFSVAGKRLGMDDPRGDLAFTALDVVRRIRPRWFVFENVPGLLSNWSGLTNRADAAVGDEWEDEENSDFAAFLGTVRECGYLGCWRSLDAQYAGLAQRRERLFFVGYLGDWRNPCGVLAFIEGMSGHPAPSRNGCEEAAGATVVGALPSGGTPRGHGTSGVNRQAVNAGHIIAFGGNNTAGPLDVATACNAHGGPHGRLDFKSETFVVSAPPIAFTCKDNGRDAGDLSPTLRSLSHHKSHANGGGQVAVTTLAIRGRGDTHRLEHRDDGTANAVLTPNGGRAGIGVGAVQYGPSIRRLTVVECARLQGFPDTYCHIETKRWRKIAADKARYLAGHDLPVEQRDGHWMTCTPADGPMYRAYGNSMAVPCIRWVLERIEQCDAALQMREAA